MLTLALVLAALAAAMHVYIWYLESLVWTGRARAVFRTTPSEAEATRELAFNQGFYNLFLAIISGVGIALVATAHREVGSALILAGTGSMLAAALVLGLSSPARRRAAITQGAIPLLTVVFIAVTLLR